MGDWGTTSAEEACVHACTYVYTQADMLHAPTHGCVRTAAAKSVLGQGPDDVAAERSSGLGKNVISAHLTAPAPLLALIPCLTPTRSFRSDPLQGRLKLCLLCTVV